MPPPISIPRAARLGLISDSHGNAARTKAALERLAAMHIDALLHCGDIGSTVILDHLVDLSFELNIPVVCVLGNVDLWDRELESYPPLAKLKLPGRTALVRAGGKLCAVVHGDDPRLFDQALATPKLRYLFTGHTHVADDRLEGSVRVINPGALHRAAEPSFATLELATGLLAVHRVT